jgi:hypothetical protein
LCNSLLDMHLILEIEDEIRCVLENFFYDSRENMHLYMYVFHIDY